MILETSYKTDIINSMYTLTKSLESIHSFSVDNVDEQIQRSFKNISNIIFNGISDIRKQIEILSEVTEWDRLNISFFGETNAGKSTIIESLINGDGKSVGEGFKDFTKSLNIISYKNINLMDMPGIEGKEHMVIENINKALNKSHVVFYVVGTNKELEELTVSKIKALLNDGIKVYSVINARGKPTAYKYKKELKDKNILVIEERIKNKFTSLLGANYAGNIVINGYLSLLRGDNLKDTRFEADQIKAIELFGNKNEIEIFSNIQEIYSIIEQLKKCITNEITISNTYKFLKTLEAILGQILREKKNFDSLIKELIQLTIKYLYDIDKIISKYESEINSNLDVNINRMKAELKKALVKSIDKDDGESTMKAYIEDIKTNHSEKIIKEIKTLISLMTEEIEFKIKEFKDRISLQIKLLKLNGDVNFEKIFESLEISFRYVIGQIIDVGLSIWGMLIAFGINPIFGIVSGLLAIARKIWNWFFDDPCRRKQEAKNRIINEVDLLVNKLKKQIKSDLVYEIRKVNKDIKKPVIQLHKSINGMKNISLVIDNKISEIIRSQTKLGLLVMKIFLGKEIFFSHLDLQLSEAVAIGYSVNYKAKTYLSNLFRIKKINLYTSYHDWLSEAGCENGEDTFIVKNEFNFRAINSLFLHDKKAVDFKKITKE
ncbi:MAG: 50S ribosome-binding GTPase [Desulfobacterales bacterium]|nr:50S ribosome-binding GTPase [Desulfobacterales bacterium]